MAGKPGVPAWPHRPARAVPLSRIAQKSAITRPLQLRLGSTLWRINNNPFANDLVYRLPVYVGLDNFEFESYPGSVSPGFGGSSSARP